MLKLVSLVLLPLCFHSIWSEKQVEETKEPRLWHIDPILIKSVVERFSTEKIEEYLMALTEKPHVAAKKQDKKILDMLETSWKKAGLDSVSRSTYNFLLSFPDKQNPNKINLYDEKDKKVWSSKHKEDDLLPEDADEDFLHAFHGMSPKGTVTGELVYVNTGTKEDILKIKELGIDLEGKIGIARLGTIFRGDIAKNLENAGAVGAIMYRDPKEAAPNGTEPEDVYPYTIYLPPSGIERGSVYKGMSDPLSPGWTSIKGAYRLPISDAADMTKIVSQPIGYGDAEALLSKLGGEKVPKEWIGGLKIDYQLGPGFTEEFKGWKLELSVNNKLEDLEDSNLIGMILGSEEPDRYVLIGNHRDAWGYGAADPSSGTAALMEIIDVLGKMRKRGWRPRRTIVFASWCSEEYFLGGSSEYVYENIHILQSRAVAYINMDTCAAGTLLKCKASPQLSSLLYKAMEEIHFPVDNKNQTLLQSFQSNIPKPGKVLEKIEVISSGSDHAPFSFYAGVPALDVSFKLAPNRGIKDGTYPAYHTGFETQHLIKDLLDPGFIVTRTCAQVSAYVVLNLAISNILPLDIEHLAETIGIKLQELKESEVGKIVSKGEFSKLFEAMEDKLKLFQEETKPFMENVRKMSKQSDCSNNLSNRGINDKLMYLERIFITPEPLPGRSSDRHVIFSPNKFNNYGSSAFPGLTDLTDKFNELEGEEKKNRVAAIKRHLSDIMIIFSQAQNFIKQ